MIQIMKASKQIYIAFSDFRPVKFHKLMVVMCHNKINE